MTRRTRLDLGAVLKLTELSDLVIPFCIRIACELRIADLLAGGPRPVDELAEATGSDPGALRRVLRALACMGIFTEVSTGTFGLTELAEPLRDDHPYSLRASYPFVPADIKALAHFGYSLRTGEAAFDHVHGMGYWDYLAEHEDARSRFHESLRAPSRFDLRALVRAYDWKRFATVADIGGSDGYFLAGLLAKHPGQRGILVDLPEVVAAADEVLAAAGVADRCEVVGTNYYFGVPGGADAYVLKNLLNGLTDELSLAVLEAVAAAMGTGSVLLVIEAVVGMDTGRPSDGVAETVDLLTLVLGGGAEAGFRTREQLEALLDRCGLRIAGIVDTLRHPIVEIVKV